MTGENLTMGAVADRLPEANLQLISGSPLVMPIECADQEVESINLAGFDGLSEERIRDMFDVKVNALSYDDDQPAPFGRGSLFIVRVASTNSAYMPSLTEGRMWMPRLVCKNLPRIACAQVVTKPTKSRTALTRKYPDVDLEALRWRERQSVSD